MTLDKAIEILTKLHNTHPAELDLNRQAALNLGIEALTHIQRLRAFSLAFRAQRLPSETTTEPQGRRADELQKLQELRKVET